MHVGRLLLMLKQYLDRRLAGAPSWKRVAGAIGMLAVCLGLAAAGLFTAHYSLVVVGAVMALGVLRQGAVAARQGRRTRHSVEPGGPGGKPGGPGGKPAGGFDADLPEHQAQANPAADTPALGRPHGAPWADPLAAAAHDSGRHALTVDV